MCLYNAFETTKNVAGNIKAALERCNDLADEYDHACRTTKKRREAIDKLRSSGMTKPGANEKLAKAESDLAQSEKDESDARATYTTAREHIRVRDFYLPF